MDDNERYLFDLQGFLVVEDVLRPDEVAALNRLIDGHNLPAPTASNDSAYFEGFLNWAQPFVNLLDQPRLMGLLRGMLGDDFRLDHYYGIRMNHGMAALHMHGGHTPYDQPEYYYFQNDAMHNGLVVAAWNLADTGPGLGGFCCIPGSHKSNYRLPHALHDAHVDAPGVVVPPARAGSLVIFTEALTHGTAAWTAAHQRRSLLYKYSPAQQSWAREYPKIPSGVTVSQRQRLLFEPPYHQDRTSLFAEETAAR